MPREKAICNYYKNIATPIETLTCRLVIFVLFSFLCIGSRAQIITKTMMPDVDYAFLDKLIAAAKINYPRTHTFEHRVLAQEENLKKARLGWFDVFTFSFLYSPNNSTTLVNPSILNGYQIGIFFNIGGLLKNKHIIGQAKEDKRITEYERDEYYINLTTLVKQRYFTYLQQVAVLKLRLEAQSESESNLEVWKHKFETGEVQLDDYNKALTTLADRVQSKIESEGTVLVAKASLEELVGKKIEEIK